MGIAQLACVQFYCLQILMDDLQMTVDRLFNMPNDTIRNVLLVNEIAEVELTKLIKSLSSLHKHYGKYIRLCFIAVMLPL